MTISLSVVLPIYKPNPDFLGVMLDSILGQILLGDELVIHFDDGDSSSLEPKYSSLPNVHVLPVVNGEFPLGVNQAFRRLVSAATNEIVVFADQDDCWIPGRLSRIRSFFSENRLNKSVFSMRPMICDSELSPVSANRRHLFVSKRMPRFFCLIYNSHVGNCLSVKKSFFLYYTSAPYGIVGMYDWHIGVIASLLNQLHWDESFGTYWRLHSSSATFNLRSSPRILQKIIWRLRFAAIFLLLLFDSRSWRKALRLLTCLAK